MRSKLHLPIGTVAHRLYADDTLDPEPFVSGSPLTVDAELTGDCRWSFAADKMRFVTYVGWLDRSRESQSLTNPVQKSEPAETTVIRKVTIDATPATVHPVHHRNALTFPAVRHVQFDGKEFKPTDKTYEPRWVSEPYR